MYDQFDDDGGKRMPGHLTQQQMQRQSKPRMSTAQIHKLKNLKKMKSSDDSDQYDVFDDEAFPTKTPLGGPILRSDDSKSEGFPTKTPVGGPVFRKKNKPYVDTAVPGEETSPEPEEPS